MAKDYATAEDLKDTGKYEKVPYGKYICTIDKCEYGRSKAGRAQLVTWFKVAYGKYKGRIIFDYQSIENPVGKQIAQKVMGYYMDNEIEHVFINFYGKKGKKNPDIVFDSISSKPYMGPLPDEEDANE